MQLDLLPAETLQQIARHLHATHRPSLYSFSLASRVLRGAALASVFWEVRLAVRRGPDTLRRDVDALFEALSAAQSAHHVRNLKIRGFLRPAPTKAGDDESSAAQAGQPTGSTADDNTQRSLLSAAAEVSEDEESSFHGDLVEDAPAFPDEEAAWAPVISLVERLPRLVKLVYDCKNQFPAALLDALHRHRPQCRLHHLHFRLRSIHSETPDPSELALATSPCLHNIRVRYCRCGRRLPANFNEHAAVEIAAGLAPNLRMVHLCLLRGSTRPPASAAWRALLPRLTTTAAAAVGPTAGSLTSLSLRGAIDFTPELLQGWSRRADFASLRHLALGGGHASHDGVGAAAMRWLVENCSFPRLRTLRVVLDDQRASGGSRSDHIDSAVAFLRALEPLHELSVSGALEPKILLDGVLARHGPGLRKLGLRPSQPRFSGSVRPMPMVFDKEHVRQIQHRCPKLEELAMPVKRTRSDAREVEMYRALGQMERLQTLCVTLDCSEWRARFRLSDAEAHRPFDGDDGRLYLGQGTPWMREGHVREAFANCAVDEALARSVWDVVCRAKRGRPLRSLNLETAGGGNFGCQSVDARAAEFVDHLSRSWLLERSIRDDEDGGICVRELGRQAREARDAKMRARDQAALAKGEPLPNERALQIFRRIWPAKEGSTDWRDDWTSLPLHEEPTR